MKLRLEFIKRGERLPTSFAFNETLITLPPYQNGEKNGHLLITNLDAKASGGKLSHTVEVELI